jgi:C-terminal processing protease CtpA/Prc
MKSAITFFCFISLHGLTLAQSMGEKPSMEEKLLISATLMPIHACATQFPDLKLALEQGFERFVKSNRKYLTEPMWKKDAKAAEEFPQFQPLTRDECDQYTRELPNNNLDKAIDRVRALKSCEARLEKAYELSERAAIGIDLERSKWAVLAKIRQVAPGRPAARSGLRENDLVLSYNGTTLKSGCDLALLVVSSKPNVPAPIVVERNGQNITFMVTPEIIKNED